LSRLASSVLKFGERLIDFIEVVAIVFVSILVAATTYVTIRDLVVVFPDFTLVSIQAVVNDVFTIIIYAEVLRSILALRRGREIGFLIPLSEVGFVVVVKEILVSAITRGPYEVLLSALSLLVIAATIYVVRVKIRSPTAESKA